ncbi:alpha/beta hydrolase [Burkholderia ubonensis]|uniref:alpha/beta fold hydrolase n=1 Tax=Burkholderia ubonensis TaxID=101571 RepID=UPI0007548D7E|nr:alpha/beta hydrolase [Burkholderia ubonensis]KVM10295.1 alpha/beta hydrolase [Burkholderia ubonensis]KVM13060.1 alpha/beta hydrolase [Burkholderia ubonensis]KVM50096.1 alpha/beta hydrolase [Burkholderia ubonensis]KVO06895.1 alpha/beta hydrolase [Burkholderia ubonensis]KVO19123.1 alpha/beta hydrolase [Burkholderia ubonensis]
MAYFTSSERRNYFAVFSTGRPLVLLHGITNSGCAWGAQLGPFVAAGYQVIVPDHAGHGASGPLQAPVSVADLADDVRTLLDELAIGSADVVGLSLGGLVAMQLALEAPERVGRLVIANSFPAFNGDDVRAMVRSWIDTFREPDGPTKRFEKTWPINASEAFRRSAEGMRMYQLLHGLAAVANGESLAHVAEGIVGFDAEARLSHLEHDTLFVAGALDTMSPPALSRRMAEAAPRGRYIELPHAAHLSNVDSAQAFNEAVLAFLSDKG